MAGFDGWRREHPTPTVPFFLPLCAYLARLPAGMASFPLALGPLCKKVDLWLRLAGGEEKREDTERTLFLNYLRPLHPTGRHPVPFRRSSFYTNTYSYPDPSPYFPYSSQSLDWAPASPMEEEILWV